MCFQAHERKSKVYNTSHWQSIFDISSPSLWPQGNHPLHVVAFNLLKMKLFPLYTPTFLHKTQKKIRYGREDEEVMGLKFCNEAIIAFHQIWPKIESEQQNFKLSPLQVLFDSFSSFFVPLKKLEIDSQLNDKNIQKVKCLFSLVTLTTTKKNSSSRPTHARR